MQRAEPLGLQTDKDTVEIVGNLRVLAGSEHRLVGPMDVGEAASWILDDGDDDKPSTSRLGVFCAARTLRHGDEVQARGVLRKVAREAPGTADYRAPAVQRQLTPLPGEDAVLIAAVKPPAYRPNWRRLLVGGLLLGVLVAFAGGYVGRQCIRWLEADEVAACFPHDRDRALSKLSSKARSNKELSDEERIRQVLAFDEIYPDCEDNAPFLFEHGQFAVAAEKYASCSKDEHLSRAISAWAMLGKFDRASDLITKRATGSAKDGRRDGKIFLLAGRLKEAAKAIRREANGPTKIAPDLRCVALSLEAQAGSAGARKELAEKASKTEVCRIAHASLLEGKERLGALSFLSEAPPKQRYRQKYISLSDLLAEDAGGGPFYWPQLQLPDFRMIKPHKLLAGKVFYRAHGLEQRLLDRLAASEHPDAEQRPLRRWLATRATNFELLTGRVKLATRWADLAASDTEMLIEGRERYLEIGRNIAAASEFATHALQVLEARARSTALQVIVALYAGDLPRAIALAEPWGDASPSLFLGDMPGRQGQKSDVLAARYAYNLLPEFLDRVQQQVLPIVVGTKSLIAFAHHGALPRDFALSIGTWRGAGQRDGAAIAGHLDLSYPMLLLAAPRLDRGHRELASWLAYGNYYRRDVGEGRMYQAAATARIADALSAPELATEQRAIAERYRQALLQEKIAVPYTLLMRLDE
jgi:hypothetical protein